MANALAIKPFVRALTGAYNSIPPIWLMRQAGRYLPEYRALRAKTDSFLELCFDPKRAAEVTLQPIRRFGFDAAILFSDILVVPHALGQRVSFESGEGPRLDALNEPGAFRRLREKMDHETLGPVYETIVRVKQELPPAIALLGFCGAPWTVATYMIAGCGTVDQLPARLFAYQHPESFRTLIEILVEASASYLIRQLEAGVDAVQIFDTWAESCPPVNSENGASNLRLESWQQCAKKFLTQKIIGFPRGAGTELGRYIADVPIDAVGLDWTIELSFARDQIQRRVPVQGNLDPLALLVGGEALDHAIDAIVEAFGQGPFIFNLGHGVMPDTPIANVERLVARVRGVHPR